MRGGRVGLMVAGLIVTATALVCLAFAASLLGDAGQSLPRAWAALGALTGPGPQSARVARHAIEGAAVVAAIAAAVALPLGWMLARLAAGWAALARALLFYPALTLVIAWALGFALLLPGGDPVQAALSAGTAPGMLGGKRACLVVLLAPLLAGAVSTAWRRLDPVALRAAETLRIGRVRSFARLVLPELLEPLLDGAILAFLAAAAVLAVRPVPPALPLDRAAIGAIAAAAAAVALAAGLLWRAVAQRAAS